MTFNIIIGVLLVATTTLIGYKIGEKYKYRKDYFEALSSFNNELSCDVMLYKSTLEEKILTSPDILRDDLLQAVDYLFEDKKFVCENKKLLLTQRELVSEYISSIGISDAVGQVKLLNAYNERLKSAVLSADLSYQKYSKLSTKLGFSLGLVVMIVML